MTANLKMVLGIGINDAGYVVKKNERFKDDAGKTKSRQTWICPYYRRWMGMLYRATPEHSRRRKSYKGASICDDWVYFSRFKEWVESQEQALGADEIAKRQLDKDILSPGNKVYSPATCIFVLPKTNYFFTDSRAARGDLPVGVSFHKGIRNSTLGLWMMAPTGSWGASTARTRRTMVQAQTESTGERE